MLGCSRDGIGDFEILELGNFEIAIPKFPNFKIQNAVIVQMVHSGW
jgi:hypothetical protein